MPSPRRPELAVAPAPAPRSGEWAGGLVTRSYGHRDYWRRRFLALADAAALLVAFAVATSIAAGGWELNQAGWMALSLPAWLAVFTAYGLYNRELKRISHSSVDDVPWIFHAMLVGSLVMWGLLELLGAPSTAAAELALFALVGFVLVLLSRTAVRRASQAILTPERVLIVAKPDIGEALINKMQKHPEYGLEPAGALATSGAPTPAGLPLLGEVEDLGRVAHEHRIERVVVSATALDPQGQVELLRRCRDLALKVSLLPEVFDAMGPSVEIDDVEGITVLGVNPPVLSRSSRIMKRSLDLVGAIALLVATAPILLVIVVAIKVTSPGPVFFRQKRIGRGGRPFEVLKFRTMYRDAEGRVEELRALSKDPNWLHLERDPRVTSVGRLLRMSSLDELPQLLNVVKGEMSLVGPRPLIESEDRLVDGWGRSRLELTPGMTGVWQVLGRTSIPFEEMVKLDYLYVANWSAWNDVRLILRTLPAVLSQRGAN